MLSKVVVLVVLSGLNVKKSSVTAECLLMVEMEEDHTQLVAAVVGVEESQSNQTMSISLISHSMLMEVSD